MPVHAVPEISLIRARTALAPLTLAILTLAGCGGGGGSDAATSTQSISGVVIDGPIQGATVCLDVNRNGSCDAGEPTSSATNAQGAYTIKDLTSDQLASGAPLLAVIPETALDNGVKVAKAYSLSAPASKPDVISPITHLVQSAVSQGMSLSDAEATVAKQLQVQAASLYTNYVDASSGDGGKLAAVVPTLVASIQAGDTMDVSPATSSTAGYTVRTFDFSNAQNYYLRYYYSDNVVDPSTGLYTWYDKRVRVTGGNEASASTIYGSELYATPGGWISAGPNVANTNTAGSPNISSLGIGYTYVSTRKDVDVSGRPISEVVAMAQDLTANTVSTVLNVDPSKLSGTMPTGAKVRKLTSIETASPVGYRVSDGIIGKNVTSLTGMVTAFPIPAAGTAINTSNSVSMGGLHGSDGCGQAVCTQERLRAAFGSGNAVNWYLCDVVVATNVQSNCTAQGSGTYSLGTAADGTTPIMTFSGLPAVASVQTFTRVFVERGGRVYFGWQDKFVTSKQTRLNKVAFEALAAALGITPPSPAAPSVADFAGTWSATYSGGDTGSCPSLTITSAGNLSGNCASTPAGQAFSVSGTITADGHVTFASTSNGATFTGQFGAGSGSGTWKDSGTLSGTWTANKP
jgi:hypothetical protein